MTTSSDAGDLDKLRGEFPDWRFGAQWTPRTAGPDVRLLWAFHPADSGSLITAWSANDLRARMQENDAT